MKKLIRMVFVLMMAMSLAACGSDKQDGQIVDAKNPTTQMEEETTVAAPELTAEAQMWMERIPGEYQGFDMMNGKDVSSGFIMHDDQTCTLGENSYTWQIAVSWQDNTYKCDEDSAEVFIYDGQTLVNKLSLSLQEAGCIRTSLYTMTQYGNTVDELTYYNMADIEVVQITLDNWADYFAELERITTTQDAFGDITAMQIYNYIAMKETCGQAVAPLSNVVVEYSCVKEQKRITVDTENLTYRWGETVRTGSAANHTTAMGGHVFEEVGEEHYGFLPCISYTLVDKFPEDEATDFTSLEILRITGTMYYVPVK